jgi:phospholipase C
MRRRTRTVAVFAALVLGGCAGPSSSTAGVGPHLLPGVSATIPLKIQHVVVVIQENRTFDNMFATFPGADGARFGRMSDGKRIALLRAPLDIPKDVCHVYPCFEIEYDNGRMDGFDRTYYAVSGSPYAGTYVYRYTDPKDIEPYWKMAHDYVLADHMFETQGSASFSAHLMLIAGGTAVSPRASVIDAPWSGGVPWGCDGAAGTTTPLITVTRKYLAEAGPFPCFTWVTISDRLDRAGISWKYYTPNLQGAGSIWNPFDAIASVRYSNEWTTNISSPDTNIFRDIRKNELPAVSWVVPDFQNSDHPGGPSFGPEWVASIVNAIGQSSVWSSTAIIVLWDDWGGLYDHVPPPQIDYESLGMRVPMIVVSPFAKKGYVSHTQYEFGSILKFIEENWGLASLRTTDVRANNILDVFDFNAKPRAFQIIPSRYSASFFIHQKPSNRPVDTE